MEKKEYKIGDGVLLIPSNIEEKIVEILRKNKAKYKSTRVWR